MTKVYAIISGKGGVGKTTIATNLGVSLGRLRKRILVIDADLAMGGVDTFLGIGETSVALHDLLAGKGNVRGAVQSAYGIKAIPSGQTLDGFLKSDPEKLKSIVDRVKREQDYVFIDTPPGLNKYSLSPLKAADEALLVVTPELPSIEAVKKLQVISGVLGKKTKIIVNRLRKPSFFNRLRGVKFMESKDIERKLKTEILGEIPEDSAVTQSVNARKPVVVYKPKGSASKAFDELAKEISGVKEKEKPKEEKKPEEKKHPEKEEKPEEEKPEGKPEKEEKPEKKPKKKRVSKPAKKKKRVSRPVKKKK
ncbi:MAG: cell division ATPase MinD [Candidatus Hadarchaeota archaeon]|nr:cell division ATPase MinD [Candidatus Hadarchaeota archaeon]